MDAPLQNFVIYSHNQCSFLQVVSDAYEAHIAHHTQHAAFAMHRTPASLARAKSAHARLEEIGKM